MSAEKAPILILQMQRMGDLILSFPLVLWLSRRYPGHPIWMMAEEVFYEPLMNLSPETVYFPWADRSLAFLRSRKFHLVLNLSHDPRAALLAGQVESDEVVGPMTEASGTRYIRGDWQLYRTSLVRSNRHNRFHWADLNALDVISPAEVAATGWTSPRTITADARRKVGLFIGASDQAKRPEPEFWAALSRELLNRDLRPVILGGPAEEGAGRAVAKGLPANVLNLCGKLTLAELAMIGQTLGLMITPDTGPMHLASWTGLPTLNLSMGNVNCWETGPYQPGHHILRARASCVGCWECSRPGIPCRESFLPRHVAYLAHQALDKKLERYNSRPLPSLDLYETGRSKTLGLYHLRRLAPDSQPSARALLDDFWQHFWGGHFGAWPMENAAQPYATILQTYPSLDQAFRRGLARFGKDLSKALASRGSILKADFWEQGAQALQPLRGYCQLYLENNDYTPRAWAGCLGLVEKLLSLISSH